MACDDASPLKVKMANIEVIIHIYVELATEAATGTVHLLRTDVPVLAAMQNTHDSRSRECEGDVGDITAIVGHKGVPQCRANVQVL